jgi:RpiB/LacA/LacB family sugar-phosphate isomerase
MKPTVLVPLAGKGSRFKKEEWIVPKPLILIDYKTIIEWSMDSIDTHGCDLVFIVRKDHVEEFSIDDFLKDKFGSNVQIVVVDEVTRGSVETCLAAEEFIKPDAPLIIHCSDVFFQPKFQVFENDRQSDGCILTFKSNSPNYSYSLVDEKGLVQKVAEKSVISDEASAGVYVFNKGSDFIHYGKAMIQLDLTTNGEFYIAPLYNLLIEDGKKITTKKVDKMHIFGTPEEYKFFVDNTIPTFQKKTVALCSDHSGFLSKSIFKNILEEQNIEYIDFGCFNLKDTDYTQYVKAACKAITDKKCTFGVGFCRSGQGVNISANKIKGIRSAWVQDSWSAEMAIRHNCANFLAVSEFYNNEVSMKYILNSYLASSFDGGRHQNRLMKNEY